MELLPDAFPVLDLNLQPSRRSDPWRRVETSEQKHLHEKHWDAALLQHVELVESALRNARVIDESSRLLALGAQFQRVDVLLAEVAGDDEKTLRRLILVENKLVRNPQSKREVLAQIMEYASNARAWQLSDLLKAFPERTEWLEDNDIRLRETLQSGEMLLVIAGDRIDPSLHQLAQRFVKPLHPVVRTELCLLSLSTFGRGDELLLVPHVVSAFHRSHRELEIHVTVQSEQAGEIRAVVEPGTSAGASDLAEATESSTTSTKGSTKADPAVTAFLRGLQGKLGKNLVDVGWIPTDTPKKMTDWHFVPDMNLSTYVGLRVHFGGYTKDWSPIQVGMYTLTTTPGLREKWKEALEGAKERGELPGNLAIQLIGSQTISAYVPFPWKAPSELTVELQERVAETFRAIETVVTRLVGGDRHPEVERFLDDVRAQLDPEMESADWVLDSYPSKCACYHTSNDKNEEASLLVHFGGTDGADWSAINVGFIAKADSQEVRDTWRVAIDALATENALPPHSEVCELEQKRISVMCRFEWTDRSDLNTTLREQLCATCRRLRATLAQVTGIV